MHAVLSGTAQAGQTLAWVYQPRQFIFRANLKKKPASSSTQKLVSTLFKYSSFSSTAAAAAEVTIKELASSVLLSTSGLI